MGGAVPLSEHEQRQLEQIEQALYADYPKLAQSVRAQDPRVHYKRRVVEAAIGFLIGVGLLLAGVISKIIPVGVGGFLVMLACAMWALTSWRHMGGSTTTGRSPAPVRAPGVAYGPGPGPARGTKARRSQSRAKRRRRDKSRRPRAGFMERLEERWRRRQEGGQ
jgi:Protein of unknown function (DUF3040)